MINILCPIRAITIQGPDRKESKTLQTRVWSQGSGETPLGADRYSLVEITN
ncbi:hypothetical protein AG1IA_07414 [Rhizoctonia solani AG-1 IA]|uniref:Uncharacterized protein n=1 Tax=Thanatephorus cucumeris (strain AG1-IA) TaxID=983506 RepID=L8WK40_THACA|nr:hypothetical protein AG1IA_07414 [Rhizoctonia solani AG-1 IA]